jgi:hypothetical protein
MEQSVFKEYSFRKIFSESLKLFKENFKLILIITLIVYTPVNIILVVFQVNKLPLWQQTLSRLTGLIEIIGAMAIIILIKSKLDGVSLNLKSIFKKSLAKWPKAVVTSILTNIFLILLFLMLIIPGIIYSVYWTFNLYSVVLCDKFGKGAMDYSKSLVKGRWWKVLSYAALINILVVIFSLIIGAVFSAIFSFIKVMTGGETIFEFLGYMLSNIIFSFSQVALTIFFLNLVNTQKGITGLGSNPGKLV